MSTESTLPPTPKGYRPLHLVLYVLITVLLLCAASFGGYLYGYSHSPAAPQKVIRVLVPAPTKIVLYLPIGAPPPYQQDLHSGNSYLFVYAFSLALTYQDATSIASITDTKNFVEICHKSDALEPGNCNTYRWSTFSTQLTQDKLEIGIDPYSHMTESPPVSDMHVPKCPNWPNCWFYLSGQLDNKSPALPLPHFGGAIFSFTTCCGGSERTFILESVDLY